MIPDEVDVIVCGGGSTGCCVAGRLARASPDLQVLIVEAGANNYNDPWVYRPAVFPHNQSLESKKVTFYRAEPSEHLLGRRAVVPVANILGGGSSINFLMYTRASASDWDDFNTEGWRAEQLIPYMRNFEDYQRPCQNPEIHGMDGEIASSFGGQITPLAHDYLRSAESLGIPFTNDLQDLKTAHGSEIWMKWINKETGRRSDAAHGFVHNHMERSTNLHLKTNSKVNRVLFEENKAVAVEIIPSRNVGDGDKPPTKIIKARKQIIINAGTLGSPCILQRSGVGDKKLLEKLGIECLVDIPWVGRNYQDHYLTLQTFRAPPEETTMDDFLRGKGKVQDEMFREWEATKSGLVASNGIDAGCKLRPSEEDNAEMIRTWPEWKDSWDYYFKNKPDKPVILTSIISAFFGDHAHVPPGKYYTMFSFLEYPFSRGSVQIRSPDPYDPPIFDAGFMNDSRDTAPLVWSYKISREIARRMEGFRGELTSLHPHFHPSSPARCVDLTVATSRKIQGPSSLSAGVAQGNWATPYDEATWEETKKKKVVYSKEDDKAIELWIREHIETTWHGLGTLAMAPRDKMGVLDPRLRVYGTENLRVGDLSICPDNIGTSPYSAALMIAEKCAHMVAEDIGFPYDLKHPV